MGYLKLIEKSLHLIGCQIKWRGGIGITLGDANLSNLLGVNGYSKENPTKNHEHFRQMML